MADDSRATDVGARYAQAVFDLAIETGQLDRVESDLAAVEAMLAESAELRGLLASPRFAAEDKAQALAALAARAGLSDVARKFLGLVATNGRASALGVIARAFRTLLAAHRGEVAAEVTTAVPMTPAQADALSSALRSALGKDPKIATRVDPAILGGVKVRVGSRLYDASIKSKLDSLKFALKRA